MAAEEDERQKKIAIYYFIFQFLLEVNTYSTLVMFMGQLGTNIPSSIMGWNSLKRLSLYLKAEGLRLP